MSTQNTSIDASKDASKDIDVNVNVNVNASKYIDIDIDTKNIPIINKNNIEKVILFGL